jgi:hypothetical protein
MQITANCAYRTSMFDNMYIEMARVIGRPYLDDLIKRYNSFREDLPAGVLAAIPASYSGAQVNWLTLAGPAAGSMHYSKVNLNVFLTGKPECENMNQEHRIKQYDVSLHFKDTDQLNYNKYLLFVFSKPVLWGSVPVLFADRIDGLIAFGIRKSLAKSLDHINNINQLKDEKVEMGKACGFLMDVYRFALSLYALRSMNYPSNFVTSVKTLYEMDSMRKYDRDELLRIWNIAAKKSGLKYLPRNA